MKDAMSLMAPLRHHEVIRLCPLTRVKRSCGGHCRMTESETQRGHWLVDRTYGLSSEYPVTQISGTRKGLRGSGPGWPCATLGLAPIPPAGRRGPHRSVFPSLSDAASRSPTPPVGGWL